MISFDFSLLFSVVMNDDVMTTNEPTRYITREKRNVRNGKIRSQRYSRYISEIDIFFLSLKLKIII